MTKVWYICNVRLNYEYKEQGKWVYSHSPLFSIKIQVDSKDNPNDILHRAFKLIQPAYIDKYITGTGEVRQTAFSRLDPFMSLVTEGYPADVIIPTLDFDPLEVLAKL